MAAGQPWVPLQEGFLEAVRRRAGSAPADWHDVWALIVADVWYQQQLAACARRLIGRQHARRDWLEDVQQEAMTLLGRHLRKRLDLRVDHQRARVRFAAWMRGIIHHTCQEALRHLRRKRKPLLNLPREDLPDRRALSLLRRVELNMAIDQLGEPARTVVALRFQDFNCKEIARQLGLHYGATCRTLNHALEFLRRELHEEE